MYCKQLTKFCFVLLIHLQITQYIAFCTLANDPLCLDSFETSKADKAIENPLVDMQVALATVLTAPSSGVKAAEQAAAAAGNNGNGGNNKQASGNNSGIKK